MIWHKTFLCVFVCVFSCALSLPPPPHFCLGGGGGGCLSICTDLRGWSCVRIPLHHIVNLAQLLCQRGKHFCRTAAYRHPSPNTPWHRPRVIIISKHIKQTLAHVPVMNHFINSIVTNLILSCDTQREISL